MLPRRDVLFLRMRVPPISAAKRYALVESDTLTHMLKSTILATIPFTSAAVRFDFPPNAPTRLMNGIYRELLITT